jgi:exodeoxyribonuclease VII small subunit
MSKKKFSYSESIVEIEKILKELESGELDVDELSDKVGRVAELIKTCKEKLQVTENDVQKILDEMET